MLSPRAVSVAERLGQSCPHRAGSHRRLRSLGQAIKAYEAKLARALAGTEIRSMMPWAAARELLAIAGRRDVIDAALVWLAADGDYIVTSVPDDLEPLAVASGRYVALIRA